MTKSFWKALSPNTIFVTQDNVTKRRDYEELVVKMFYLINVTTVQELQEIATAVRSVTEIRRLFTYNAQMAILVRGTADQVLLAEKLIQDLDKPKRRSGDRRHRDGGELQPHPRPRRQPGHRAAPRASSSPSRSLPAIPSCKARTTDSGSTSSGSISLAQVGRISSNDFSLTLPGALFNAVMGDRATRVLQAPQVRAIENQKASLRIGDKIPYATGSFQPGVGSVGVSPLVSTQFNFAEVGVNVDITPKVHGSDEVSLHVELELSTVRERVEIGGIQQPVIGQRKVVHDIRIREGEVTLLGGLMGTQDSKVVNGIPGLANIPILKRLFSSESLEKARSELLIALIPRIVRSTDINEVNVKGVAAGSEQSVKLTMGPRREPAPPPPPAPKPKPEQPPQAAAPAPAPSPRPPPPRSPRERRCRFSPRPRRPPSRPCPSPSPLRRLRPRPPRRPPSCPLSARPSDRPTSSPGRNRSSSSPCNSTARRTCSARRCASSTIPRWCARRCAARPAAEPATTRRCPYRPTSATPATSPSASAASPAPAASAAPAPCCCSTSRRSRPAKPR